MKQNLQEEKLLQILYNANEFTPELSEYYNRRVKDLSPEYLKTYEDFTMTLPFRFGQLTAETMMTIYPSPDTSINDDVLPETAGKYAMVMKKLCMKLICDQAIASNTKFERELSSLKFDLGFGAGMSRIGVILSTLSYAEENSEKLRKKNTQKEKKGKPQVVH